MSLFSRLTLAIIKPDVCAVPPKLQLIKEVIAKQGLQISAEKHRRFSQLEMEQFYGEHKGKFFFNRLTTYMSSGPIYVCILTNKSTEVIPLWRKMLGATKVFRTIHEDSESIRGRFGLTDTRNAAHGSDSPDSVKNEISFFFPELTFEELERLATQS